MLIALLLAGGLAWWLHRRGELLPNLARFGGAAALALLAARLLQTGRPLFAAAALGVALLWWLSQGRKVSTAGEVARARALLGVAADADAAAIHAAWRRRMAAVHPDAGGDVAQVEAVTAARDLLLARSLQR